jgi:general secretion pathway protein G
MNARLNRRRAPRRGFTLMEVLLVLTILVVLGSFAVGLYTNVQRSSQDKAAKVQVEAIDQASERFFAMTGRYPSVIDELVHLPPDMDQIKWGGPHLEEDPNDPWGNKYMYRYPGQMNDVEKPDIYSLGEDGQEGTTDDVGNWPAQS